jgi:hypothetical protein
MRIVSRIIGALLISCLGAAPLGVSAEGYVCASGARMIHGTKAAACTHCRVGEATPVRAAFERPCCTYVGSTALPPLLNVAAASAQAPHRALSVAPPGISTTASLSIPLGAVPEYGTGSTGGSPPSVSLQRSVQLRN